MFRQVFRSTSSVVNTRLTNTGITTTHRHVPAQPPVIDHRRFFQEKFLLAAFPSDKLFTQSKKTTGWTEETRNLFHPGDIIGAMLNDRHSYSPYGLVGMSELAHHFQDSRELSEVCDDGSVPVYINEVMPRLAVISSKKLEKSFPRLKEYADSLKTRNLEDLLDQPKLVAEIEKKFGKIVEVLPDKKLKQILRHIPPFEASIQVTVTSMFSKTTVIFDSEKEKKTFSKRKK